MRGIAQPSGRHTAWAVTISCIALIVVLTNDMDGTSEVSKLVQEQIESPCASVADQVEIANAQQEEAEREHHEHVQKTAQLSSAVEEAGLTATRLQTEHVSRKQQYVALRAKLQGEVQAFSADVDKYNQLRELAITSEQKCEHVKVSECLPGPDGMPDCKEVEHENDFCKEAKKLAKQAAEHADSVKMLQGIQGQLLRAKISVQGFTQQAMAKVAEAQQEQAEAQEALIAEQNLLQEAQHRAHHTKSFASKLLHTKALCESIREREATPTAALKHLQHIKQMAQGLPAQPWKLSKKQQLQAVLSTAKDRVKSVEKAQLAEANEAEQQSTASLGATAEAADAAADALIGPAVNPQQYLEHAKKDAQQVNAQELKKLEPHASAMQRALDAKAPTPAMQAAILKLRKADRGDRAAAEAKNAMQKAKLPEAAVMAEDKAPTVLQMPVTPAVTSAPVLAAPAAPAPAPVATAMSPAVVPATAAMVADDPPTVAPAAGAPAADDVAPPAVAAADAGAAKAAADGAKDVAAAAADAAAEQAKQQAKLAKVQADAAAKVAAAQAKSPAAAAGAADEQAKQAAEDLKVAADKKKVAAKKKAAKKKADAKKKAKKNLKKQQKQALEKLKKKKARMDKEALAGIPNELEHTGTEDMKLSNARSAARLDRHFMATKKKLWQQQDKALNRLERSEGGTAARHAARHMREAAQDEVRKYEIQSVRQAMQYQQKTESAKEKALRDDYAAKFRDLERADKYAAALKQLVAESWWHGLLQTSLVQAKGKCDQLQGDAQMSCMQNMQENQLWLAKNLRAKDVVFHKKYAAFKAKHTDERKAYLAKKKDLASNYQQAVDHLKADYDEAREKRQWEMGQQARAKLEAQRDAKLAVIGDDKAAH